ncbi:MAG TPA: mechanosensitive ion channel protein MscS, partial [Alphaproteobacteria bacterium]|nr:mechanosensitive ion channel protein MscS [Alphaproteobacteria bacterium]
LTATGKTGIVKKIMIFTTELHTFDNQVIFLPNGALSNGEITNLSGGSLRRTDLTVGISYGSRVPVARRAILDILARDPRIADTPAPSVFVRELGDSAVVLTVRFWSKYGDMADASADTLEQIYNELPKKKVQFPFPQMDVHITK